MVRSKVVWVALAIVALSVSIPVSAEAVTCNLLDNVGGGPPGVSPAPGAGFDVGTGQCNGDFTIARDAIFPGTTATGLELGLRIEQRGVGQLNPPAHTGSDYTVQLGADPADASRAWWNIQHSIGYNSPIGTLDSLTFVIRTDAGSSVPAAAAFDMLLLRSLIDDRNSPKSTVGYSDIYQTSQNPTFGWFTSYDMHEEGAWTLTLTAVKGFQVASVSICVHTPNAACVAAPPPPTSTFRDVRRAADINAGPDLGGTSHDSLNFTGTGSATGDTWITVYDQNNSDSAPTLITGSVVLSADVLIHPFNNRKGAGLLALFNEGAGKKGLVLIAYDAGNTDSLVLATVDQAGKLSTLRSIILPPNAIARNEWYRLTMRVDIAGDNMTVEGKLFKHVIPTNPNSGLGPQVGSINLPMTGLTVNGLEGAGQIGVVASAFGAVVDSSVTNFSIVP